MSRGLIVALLLTFGVATRAEAGWGLRNSFGQGIYLAQPSLTATVVTPVVRDSDDKVVSGGETQLAKGCGGALCYDGNRRLPIDFELMPYYGFGLLSIDLGIVFNLESRNDLGFNFRFRPGVRIFPILGLYIRGYLDLNIAQITTAVASTGALRASFEGNLGIGVGYQLKLGPWGIFAEMNFAPRLWGNGVFNMPLEFRIGFLLEPS